MHKFILSFICLFLFAISFHAIAQQSGGGTGDDLKGVCELAGGTWTGSESGNWACCWSNWGCYGCVDGNCKMKCDTQRCRKANGQARPRPSSNQQSVDGLAPMGMKAPIVPKPAHTNQNTGKANSTKVQQ